MGMFGLSPESETTYLSPQPNSLQDPDADGYDHHDIQYGLDAGRHGDIAINQI